jgi:hypothetical protein
VVVYILKDSDNNIADLSKEWEKGNEGQYRPRYPKERAAYGGCPLVRVANRVTYLLPPLTSLPPNTLPNQQEDY